MLIFCLEKVSLATSITVEFLQNELRIKESCTWITKNLPRVCWHLCLCLWFKDDIYVNTSLRLVREGAAFLWFKNYYTFNICIIYGWWWLSRCQDDRLRNSKTYWFRPGWVPKVAWIKWWWWGPGVYFATIKLHKEVEGSLVRPPHHTTLDDEHD